MYSGQFAVFIPDGHILFSLQCSQSAEVPSVCWRVLECADVYHLCRRVSECVGHLPGGTSCVGHVTCAAQLSDWTVLILSEPGDYASVDSASQTHIVADTL